MIVGLADLLYSELSQKTSKRATMVESRVPVAYLENDR